MNSSIFRLDQIMSKLLKLEKHHLQSLLLFYIAYAEHNLIQFKLYNNWSAQVFNNVSEKAILNSSEHIKCAHIQKLAN